MTFERDNIEHEIIMKALDREFLCYDYMIELPDGNRFIKDTLKIVYRKDDNGEDTEEIDYRRFIVREGKSWWSFPLYEIKNNKIVSFDYKKHIYFVNTNRRMALASKINKLYNLPSELKILRKTLKYIMDTLNMEYPNSFKKYDGKIEGLINKNPKEK